MTATKLQQMLVILPPKTAKTVVNNLVELGLPR